MDNNKVDNKKVLFDPGYAPLIVDSIGAVGYTYYMFCAVKDLRIKRINFPNVFKKLEKLIKTNVAFYLGCLLWASYIKQFDNFEIEGNKLLNEKCTKEEYTSEINFLIDFVKNQLPKDSKYYLNKSYTPNPDYLLILTTYRDFLILNDGFVNCSKTNQIVLPESIKSLNKNELEEVNSKIQEAIKNKNIESLLDCYSFIF